MTVPFAIDHGATAVQGDLTVPADAAGVVVFAHGSGSSRHSPRNQAVAKTLQDNKFATLLFDLLSRDEEAADAAGGRLRFDAGLLAGRLVRAIDELARHDPVRGLPLGLFGASTGAAAALRAAAERPDAVRAVVSRGGRPDLAGPALAGVTSPVLLIVGARDRTVLRLNEEAGERLAGPWELLVVPGATHLFEEPGTLERVAEAAASWFTAHLG
ncbi:dienelactone hydrolase family protein [Amycolatopsis sp. NPDC059021]|uniref:dienelactone hydrolase family protein n=1 Tax=Amycolatopsis sp. NPDC059021 TaxID=3346704 RepID=UPI003671E490